MTPVEIAYFKHFLYDKSLDRSFLFYFRKNPIIGSPRGDIDANPKSIEQYFLRTSRKDVIMKAFVFYPESMSSRENSTYDYWKDIDNKWQEYMKSNESNFTNDSWPQLRKSFAILRQNWDLERYWKRDNLESTAEVYRRMNINLPLPEFQWEHGGSNGMSKDTAENTQMPKEELPSLLNRNKIEPKFKAGDKIKGSLSGDVVTVTSVCDKGYFTDDDGFVGIDRQNMWELVTDSSDAPLVDFSDEEEDPLADFDFLDEEEPRSWKLSSSEITINFNSSSFKITFNVFSSRLFKDEGFKYVRLAKSKSGDFCLIINRQKGAALSNMNSLSKNQNVTVNSKDICTKLKTIFSLNETYHILKIEKLQQSPQFIIYKISKR